MQTCVVFLTMDDAALDDEARGMQIQTRWDHFRFRFLHWEIIIEKNNHAATLDSSSWQNKIPLFLLHTHINRQAHYQFWHSSLGTIHKGANDD